MAENNLKGAKMDNVTPQQLTALKECAEFIKDIVNASDGDDPYSQAEIFEIGMKLLNDLAGSGFMLRGEQ